MVAYERSVPIRRPWLALLFALMFLPLRDYLRFNSFVDLPFAAIALWFAFLIGKMVAVNLFGIQTLQLGDGCLRLREGLFGIGRWQEFPVESISGLRLGGADLEKELLKKTEDLLIKEEVRTGRMFSGLQGVLRFLGVIPAVAFKAKGKPRWFGYGMEEMEAREVLARLRMQLPESAWQDSATS